MTNWCMGCGRDIPDGDYCHGCSRRKVTMNISDIIREETVIVLRRMQKNGFQYKMYWRYDAIIWDINNGYCEDLATKVIRRMGGETDWLYGLWMEDRGTKFEGVSHYVIKYNGKYYDAECPDGVKSLVNIPLYINRYKSREEYIDEMRILQETISP